VKLPAHRAGLAGCAPGHISDVHLSAGERDFGNMRLLNIAGNAYVGFF
jgi:hypothetical protein